MTASGARILVVHIDSIPPEGTTLTGEVEAGALGLADSDRAEFCEPVHFDLVLSVVKGKLLAQGTLRTCYSASCDRCLCAYTRTLGVADYCQYFDEGAAEEIDLTATMREDILLAFPQRLLCSDSCAGLCPSCGANLNHEGCTCSGESVANESWRVLDDFHPDHS